MVAYMNWKEKTRDQKYKIFISMCLLAGLLMLAILGPVFSPFPYDGQDVSIKNLMASGTHPMGTDKFGRDIFVRVCMGIGISMQVGLYSTACNLLIGICVGAFSGYGGGKVDLFCMRVADMISAIPSLLYMVLIMLVVRLGMLGMVLGMSVSGWVGIARIVRGEMLRLRQTDYCIAARMSGMRDLQVIFLELLPNIKDKIARYSTYMIPEAIFAEAFLSFVGIGLSAPLASLGTMIQDGRSQMNLYPLQMLYPVMVLCVMILAFQLLGAGLEED